MTEADIKAALTLAREAQARADAATPGPWLHIAVTGQARGSTSLDVYTANGHDLITRDCDDLDTAEFLAAARSDVPALADLVRRLAGEVLTLRAILSDATSESRMYEQGVRDSLAAIEAIGTQGVRSLPGFAVSWRDVLAAVRALLEPNSVAGPTSAPVE